MSAQCYEHRFGYCTNAKTCFNVHIGAILAERRVLLGSQPTAKTPAPIFTINSQMTSFRSTMCLLGVPKTKFYISTPFPPKTQILANFQRDLRKFRVKKVLTMGMLGSKLPLIVVVAP